MRMDPAPSVACAIGTMPDATAAAAPPDEPPVLCARFQGLSVGPNKRGSVVTLKPSSGRLVLPRILNPADRNRCVSSLSAGHGTPSSARKRLAQLVTFPERSNTWLIPDLLLIFYNH